MNYSKYSINIYQVVRYRARCDVVKLSAGVLTGSKCMYYFGNITVNSRIWQLLVYQIKNKISK